MAVIDLTGYKKPRRADDIENIEAENERAEEVFANTLALREGYYPPTGPWLKVKIKDRDVPNWGPDVWESLSIEIQSLLDNGTDVLVTCQGGHGRTGMVISIIAHLLGIIPEGEDPILWTRDKHCHKAVETNKQIEYIYATLGLPDPGEDVVAASDSFKSKASHPKSSGGYSKQSDGTKLKGGEDRFIPLFENIWEEFRQNFLVQGGQNE